MNDIDQIHKGGDFWTWSNHEGGYDTKAEAIVALAQSQGGCGKWIAGTKGCGLDGYLCGNCKVKP